MNAFYKAIALLIALLSIFFIAGNKTANADVSFDFQLHLPGGSIEMWHHRPRARPHHHHHHHAPPVDRWSTVPTVPAPYSTQPHGSDQQMALQSISLALAVGNINQLYYWYNPVTGFGGQTILHNRYRDAHRTNRFCWSFTTVLNNNFGDTIASDSYTACQGRGNIFTWIVSDGSVVNSVFRTAMNPHTKCRVQFSDVRVYGQGRIISTMNVCFNGHFKSWNVGG